MIDTAMTHWPDTLVVMTKLLHDTHTVTINQPDTLVVRNNS